MEIGKITTLHIVRIRDFGAFLAAPEDTDGKDTVLLPRKQMPEGAAEGDAVEVFLYKDSDDRPIATTRKPKLTVGETGRLKVRQMTKIGAFLDLGLERDVLMPFREMEGEVAPGQEVLAALYVDRSGRLAATMHVYRWLKAVEGIGKDQEVRGTVYEIREMGVFVAVEDCYFGLIPASEVYEEYRIGQEIIARVMRVREDGKLDLSPRRKAFQQMGDDAALIMERLEKAGGVLPYGDSSSPEELKKAFGHSKNAFKRAAGRLLKVGKITVEEREIRKK